MIDVANAPRVKQEKTAPLRSGFYYLLESLDS